MHGVVGGEKAERAVVMSVGVWADNGCLKSCGMLRLCGSVIVALPQWLDMTQTSAGRCQANRQAPECR